jgi:hypothetical protein
VRLRSRPASPPVGQDFGWFVINACCTGCPAGETWDTSGGDTRDARVRISDAARTWAAGHAHLPRPPPQHHPRPTAPIAAPAGPTPARPGPWSHERPQPTTRRTLLATTDPWADDYLPPAGTIPPPPVAPPDDPDDQEEVRITLCRCYGEGCHNCGNTGVIHP